MIRTHAHTGIRFTSVRGRYPAECFVQTSARYQSPSSSMAFSPSHWLH
jgi:hypothetical protein